MENRGDDALSFPVIENYTRRIKRRLEVSSAIVANVSEQRDDSRIWFYSQKCKIFEFTDSVEILLLKNFLIIKFESLSKISYSLSVIEKNKKNGIS